MRERCAVISTTTSRMKFSAALIAILFACSPFASAWEAASGPAQVGLLELYTSEGCSSCPPAQKWFSELRKDKQLWKTYVPVAFHVDYWDQLGWPDRFASPDFTARQRAYAKVWDASTVYTPGVVWNGTELRNWIRFQPSLARTLRQPGTLTAKGSGSGPVTVAFVPEEKFDGGTVHAAWLGLGLKSEVEAGENNGHTLTHDFVALALASEPLVRGEDGTWSAEVKRPASKNTPAAIAVWVTRNDSPTPIQSAGTALR